MWQSIGHESVKNLLDKQLGRQQFPHAYLFVGPEGIGKKLVAQEMAAQILQASRTDNHPDYIYYDAGTGNGMEGLREFLTRLANKPFIGQHKVAVIDNMDQANVQMSNALLKTLEEPSPSTILFVIASQNNLLPTIVSRCQMLTFNPLTLEEIKQCAQMQQVATADDILIASFGSPARLLRLVNDAGGTAQINDAVMQLNQALASGTAEKMLAINSLAEYEPDQIKDILLTWLYQLRSSLTLKPQQAATISAICQALPRLNGSFNKKLVLQGLLLAHYETA